MREGTKWGTRAGGGGGRLNELNPAENGKKNPRVGRHKTREQIVKTTSGWTGGLQRKKKQKRRTGLRSPRRRAQAQARTAREGGYMGQ